jgi:anaerobic selenocysteine-containing dehydrogenase
MSVESRRNFLTSAGKLLVSTVTLGSLAAYAAEEHTQMHAVSGDGLAVDATSKNICATCQFWGGMRKISDNRQEVIAQSMGWCNNPESPNHQKLTAADHQMNEPGIWKKWPAL